MPTATEHHQRSQARQSQSSTKDGLTSGVLPAKPWIVSRLRSMMPSRPLTFREAQVIAERQAATVLSTWGLDASDGFRVPEEVISEIPRIEVRYQTGMAQSGSSTWRAGAWRVAVSSEEWHCRQRFTLAHELKHILDSPHESQIYSDLPEATPAQRRARTRHIEALCDHFAACLLMPRMSIKRAWGNGLQNLAELAVRVSAGVVGGFTHQRSDGVVATQVPPDLLVDHVRRPRPEDHPRSALMGFQLVESCFDLPSLGVRHSEFLGSDVARVHHGGEQPDLRRFLAGMVVDGVIDQPNPERLAPADPRGFRWADLHDPRPVAEFLNRAGFDRFRDPPQQIRTGRCGLLPQRSTVETAICEQHQRPSMSPK
jgi:hypothetical protein